MSLSQLLVARLEAAGVRRAPQGEVECRWVNASGEAVEVALSRALAELVVRGRPVRSFAWYAGMRHYPGWFWSATMGDLVGYESLLERDRLWFADFDRDVVGIASQPFGLIVLGPSARMAGLTFASAGFTFVGTDDDLQHYEIRLVEPSV